MELKIHITWKPIGGRKRGKRVAALLILVHTTVGLILFTVATHTETITALTSR